MIDWHYSSAAVQAIIRHERNVAAMQALGIAADVIRQLDACIERVASSSVYSHEQLWDDAHRTVIEGKSIQGWIDRWNR